MNKLPSIKIVLYGKESVGKSALLTRFIHSRFDPEIETTIGASFSSKTVSVDDQMISLNIWDMAGSERFNTLVPMYIRGAKIVLLCFHHFDAGDLDKKIEKIAEQNMDVKIFLVATKIDLRAVSDQAIIYAQLMGYELFHTSAASGTGVDELFEKIAKVGKSMLTDSDYHHPSFTMTKVEPKGSETCCH